MRIRTVHTIAGSPVANSPVGWLLFALLVPLLLVGFGLPCWFPVTGSAVGSLRFRCCWFLLDRLDVLACWFPSVAGSPVAGSPVGWLGLVLLVSL